MKEKLLTGIVLFFGFFTMIGCGGGGNTTPPPPPPPPANTAPSVDAGADQTVEAGANVTLAGAASDSDGSVVSVSWSQVSGPSVEISNANTLNAEFSAPSLSEPITLTFQLTAVDDDGASASDSLSILVESQTASAWYFQTEGLHGGRGADSRSSLAVDIVRNTVYSLVGDTLFAVDIRTGVGRWTSRTNWDDGSCSSWTGTGPLVDEDGSIVITGQRPWLQWNVLSLQPDGATVNWTTNIQEGGALTPPALSDGVLYFIAKSDSGSTISLISIDAFNGDIIQNISLNTELSELNGSINNYRISNIAIDNDGRVVTTFKSDSTLGIAKLSKQGTVLWIRELRFLGQEPDVLGNVSDILISPANQILISDLSGPEEIQSTILLNPEGETIIKINNRNPGRAVFDEAGNFYIYNHVPVSEGSSVTDMFIQKYSGTGDLLWQYLAETVTRSSSDACGSRSGPLSLTVGESGNVYYLGLDTGFSLKVISPEGNLVKELAGQRKTSNGFEFTFPVIADGKYIVLGEFTEQTGLYAFPVEDDTNSSSWATYMGNQRNTRSLSDDTPSEPEMRVDAGPDQIVDEGQSVTLEATTGDISPIDVSWFTPGIGDVVLEDDDTLVTTFVAPSVSQERNLLIRILATFPNGTQLMDDVVVSVRDTMITDSDMDGIDDELDDNCRFFNPSQIDENRNGIGDTCDDNDMNMIELSTRLPPNGDFTEASILDRFDADYFHSVPGAFSFSCQTTEIVEPPSYSTYVAARNGESISQGQQNTCDRVIVTAWLSSVNGTEFNSTPNRHMVVQGQVDDGAYVINSVRNDLPEFPSQSYLNTVQIDLPDVVYNVQDIISSSTDIDSFYIQTFFNRFSVSFDEVFVDISLLQNGEVIMPVENRFSGIKTYETPPGSYMIRIEPTNDSYAPGIRKGASIRAFQ